MSIGNMQEAFESYISGTSPKVRIIPAIINQLGTLAGKLRIAAYARVSTDSEDQLNSFNAQSDYYNDSLGTRADIDYVGLYADEGITGTLIKKRKDFKRLIADCEQGKIDRIITKSVSRFARNLVECIKTTRALKEQGVTILFEAEGIDTAVPGHETMLAFAATIAESSSRSSSENLVWRIRKKFAEGKVHMGKTVYGYTIEKANKDHPIDRFIIVKEEAEIVSRIYKEFVGGKTIRAICDGLTAEGILTPSGKTDWSTHTVNCILRSEKYVGDLILQKTFKADLLSDRQMNKGERDRFEIKEHHIGIIDRQLWNLVQVELGNRKKLMVTKNGKSSKVSRAYAFSNKLVCGDCNTILTRTYWRSKNNKYYVWVCSTEHKFGACNTKPVHERKIEEAFVRMINKLIGDKESFLGGLKENIAMVLDQSNQRTRGEVLADIEARQNEILALAKIYEKNAEDFKRGETLMSDIDALRQELATIQKAEQYQHILAESLQSMDAVLSKTFDAFDAKTFGIAIDRVIIHPKQRNGENASTKLTFVFKCGIEITEKI